MNAVDLKNTLVIAGRGELADDSRTRVGELLDAFRARRSEKTRKAYDADLRNFTLYLKRENIGAAVWELISQGPGKANSMALQYKGALISDGQSPAADRHEVLHSMFAPL